MRVMSQLLETIAGFLTLFVIGSIIEFFLTGDTVISRGLAIWVFEVVSQTIDSLRNGGILE